MLALSINVNAGPTLGQQLIAIQFIPTHVDVGQTLALHRSYNVEGCEVLTIYFALVNTYFSFCLRSRV